MTLEQICVSKKLAKELEEAGYPQNTYFNWMSENWSNDDWEDRIEANDYSYDCRVKVIASAPTVAELGEELPDNMCSVGKDSNERGKENPWSVIHGYEPTHHVTYGKNMAEAMAKMWLYLNKEGLL